jgi:cytochrome c oxidase subunit 2
MSAWPFWPDQASAYSGEIDRLSLAFTALVMLLSAPVFLLLVAFAVKYRRGRAADRSHPVNRKVGLEISWALIPFALVMIF